MDHVPPTGEILFNYDTDRDIGTGLLVLTTQKGLNETTIQRLQAWTTGPLVDCLSISRDLYVTFFAAIENFETGTEGRVEVFLRDHDGAGGYIELGKATVIDRDWQKGSTAFIQQTLVFPGILHSISPGHEVEVRFVVQLPGGQNMWFAYDTEAHPAVLVITSEFTVGGRRFYTHNDPTPPVGDTQSHDVLPMDSVTPTAETLFNYATDHDNAPGLLIQKTSLGLAETDPRKFQAWRTATLTGDLVIEEDSVFDFWASSKNFNTGTRGEVIVFLRDCFPDGSYIEIGEATIFENDWQGGITGDFVSKSLIIRDSDQTLVLGHKLEIKVVVGEKSAGAMWFCYDTVSCPAVLFPSVEKSLGSAIGASIEAVNGAETVKPLPVSFSTADFQPFTFDFAGDVDLKQVPEVWVDPQRTQLMIGVYHTTWRFTLGEARGQVTLIARDIKLKGQGSSLTPFLKNVLLFATGSDLSGVAVTIRGSDHCWQSAQVGQIRTREGYYYEELRGSSLRVLL